MKVTLGNMGSHSRTGLLRTGVLVALALGIAMTLLFAARPVAASGSYGFLVPIVLEEFRTPPAFIADDLPSVRDVQAQQTQTDREEATPANSQGSSSGSVAATLNCMGANALSGECTKLTINRATDMCGSTERPLMTHELVTNGIEYRCHVGEGVWVKFQYQRTAAEHELVKYPVGPCDRQQTVYDPIRDKEFLRVNENYSQEECDAHIASLLASALEQKRKEWGNGPAVAFCTVIDSPGDSQGNAYGQVYLFTPSGEGHNGTNTLVFHGLYDTAVKYASSASGCNP